MSIPTVSDQPDTVSPVAGIIAAYFDDEVSFAETARRLLAAGEFGDPAEILAHGPLLPARYCHGCGAIRYAEDGPCVDCADDTALLVREGRKLPHIYFRPQAYVDPRDIVEDCRYCGRHPADPQCCDGIAAALEDADVDLIGAPYAR